MALIYLWRYRENTRNYPGYHLTADPAGCDQLISLTEQLEKAKSPVTRQVELSPVNERILDVPNNTRGNKTVISLKFWKLECDPQFRKSHFVYDNSYPTCTLELSPQQAGCIAEGIRDIKRGKAIIVLVVKVTTYYGFGGLPNNFLRLIGVSLRYTPTGEKYVRGLMGKRYGQI